MPRERACTPPLSGPVDDATHEPSERSILWRVNLIHLGCSLALPDDEPFTFARARRAGVTRRQLAELVENGVVRRLLLGVYAAADLPVTQLVRAQAVRLVVPEGFVVTDESAGWLAGAPMILRGDEQEDVPPLTVFATGDHGRLRNGSVDSGRRELLDRDVTDLFGLSVTTPLRTFLDLGRLRHRDRAIGALDQLLALGAFDLDDVARELPRFRGMRGVVQLRALAPLTDRRAESPPESTLRLRFHDGGLPTPTPQVNVFDEHGTFLGRADLAVPEIGFAAEYDGEQFHGPDRTQHDLRRRAAMDDAGWVVRVIRKENLFGHHQDVVGLLASGVREARRRGDRPLRWSTTS